jgi:hypothetical protein
MIHKYAAPFDFFGRSHAALLSETYIICCYVRDFWAAEYRIDYPRDYSADADIAAFMKALRWTIHTQRVITPSSRMLPNPKAR